jgi:plasmid stabilization system protein ParE
MVKVRYEQADFDATVEYIIRFNPKAREAGKAEIEAALRRCLEELTSDESVDAVATWGFLIRKLEDGIEFWVSPRFINS